MQMGRRFLALRAEVHDPVLEEGHHAIIDVGPLFARIKEYDPHRLGVLQDPNPVERVHRRQGLGLLRARVVLTEEFLPKRHAVCAPYSRAGAPYKGGKATENSALITQVECDKNRSYKKRNNL